MASFTNFLHQVEKNPPVLVGVVPLSMVQSYIVTEGYKAAASLYRLAIEGTTFDVASTVANGIHWVFDSILFSGCYMTSANPIDVTVGTTTGQLDTNPVATFSGIVTKFLGKDGKNSLTGQ